MHIHIPTLPQTAGHEHRGIGLYTKMLTQELQKLPNIHLTVGPLPTTQPDPIHYPFFDFFFATLPFSKKVPTVVTIHDVIPLQFPDQYKPGIRGTLKLYAQKFSLKNAAAVVTDSDASRAAINQHLGVPLEKIHTIYLAGNPEIKPLSPSAVAATLKQYHLAPNYLLYVGDINYNKNIPELIHMLKFLPAQYHLVLAGKNFKPQPIPEWQRIEEAVARYTLTERITFIPNLGDTPTQTLSALFQGATAYIQPSLAEGFGLPVLEAFQVGTPVISSSTTSLPEVGGSVAVYCTPTAEDLAKTFLATVAVRTTSERAAFQTKATAWLTQFSWQKTAQQTAALYTTLI